MAKSDTLLPPMAMTSYFAAANGGCTDVADLKTESTLCLFLSQLQERKQTIHIHCLLGNIVLETAPNTSWI